jgi:hypothetical protein
MVQRRLLLSFSRLLPPTSKTALGVQAREKATAVETLALVLI